MEEDKRAEEARRAKEAGNDAYRKSFLETAVEHYTRGALLDPRDISFLTNRAAAYFHMGKVSHALSAPPHSIPSQPTRRLTIVGAFSV
jgi:Flp pilus assembly protein TadD